ncbi:MAG: GNAT family N-acetyltransferase [Rhodospirillales bacterium]|nr:GNAT family N-acetyltransferase [Rhodospirillales bacterium]
MSLHPMRLTPAAPTDCYVLAAIHAACFSEAWDARSIYTLLTPPHAIGIIAWSADTIAGFVLCRAVGDECEILSCASSPLFRRQGVGMRVLTAALDEARQRGVRRAFLEVAEDNAAARALYTACGLSDIGRRRRYYRRITGAADAIVMSLDL